MNMLTLVYGRGNAKAKRARRGMERDWNRFDEPLKKLLRGKFSNHRWLRHRKRKFEKDVDNLRRVWHNADVT